jgi:rare lipoprotein A
MGSMRVVGGGGWRRPVGVGLACAILFAACSSRTPPTPPPSTLVGVASWYGPGFDGRRTASGEIYNQEELTAASTIFPLGTHLMVTNLDNQKSIEVRINDRGPFRKGRKLDLSHAAARVLGIVNPGTARCRMDVLSTPAGTVIVAGGVRYFVQAGSFAIASNAENLRARLAARYADVRIDTLDAGKHRYYRVRMGAFSTRDEALARAAASTDVGLPMLVVAE